MFVCSPSAHKTPHAVSAGSTPNRPPSILIDAPECKLCTRITAASRPVIIYRRQSIELKLTFHNQHRVTTWLDAIFKMILQHDFSTTLSRRTLTDWMNYNNATSLFVIRRIIITFMFNLWRNAKRRWCHAEPIRSRNVILLAFSRGPKTGSDLPHGQPPVMVLYG